MPIVIKETYFVTGIDENVATLTKNISNTSAIVHTLDNSPTSAKVRTAFNENAWPIITITTSMNVSRVTNCISTPLLLEMLAELDR